MQTKHHIVDTPLGKMLFAGNEHAIQKSYWLSDGELAEESAEKASWLPTLVKQLESYFLGAKMDFDLPLEPIGTEFQQQVWRELMALSHGKTTTYLKLAHTFGNKSLSQAVGGAVGANPLLLLIPCHRVIGTDGSLTGYAGGLKRKAFLLRLEGVISSEQMELGFGV